MAAAAASKTRARTRDWTRTKQRPPRISERSDQLRGRADRKEPTNLSGSLYDVMEKAVKALQNHSDLPESISFSITQEGLWVMPWILGAPLQAILAWHDALIDPTRTYIPADGYTKVEIRGNLDDVPVIAQVVTYQELTGRNGRLSEAELRRTAKAEEPFEAESDSD